MKTLIAGGYDVHKRDHELKVMREKAVAGFNDFLKQFEDRTKENEALFQKLTQEIDKLDRAFKVNSDDIKALNDEIKKRNRALKRILKILKSIIIY